MVMEAAVDITYFVACSKYFLGISIVAVMVAAHAKRGKLQPSQTVVLWTTGYAKKLLTTT